MTLNRSSAYLMVGLVAAVCIGVGPATASVMHTFDIQSGGAIQDSTATAEDPISETSDFNFDVVGAIGTIEKIEIRFSAQHTSAPDLSAVLISPSNTQVQLFFRIGGFGADFQDTYFDDDATASIDFASPPFNGAYRLNAGALLSDFDGENAHGTWRLEVTDHATEAGFEGVGSLIAPGDNAWAGTQLFVTVPEPATMLLLVVAGPLLLRRKRR